MTIPMSNTLVPARVTDLVGTLVRVPTALCHELQTPGVRTEETHKKKIEKMK